MSPSMRNALRTLIQALSGGLITAILDLVNVVELTDAQNAALATVLTVASSVLMNFVEDKGVYAIGYPQGDKSVTVEPGH